MKVGDVYRITGYKPFAGMVIKLDSVITINNSWLQFKSTVIANGTQKYPVGYSEFVITSGELSTFAIPEHIYNSRLFKALQD